jgi:hypothetical protein
MASVNQVPLISTVNDIILGYKGTVGKGVSLADVSKIARAEPITLISSDLNGTKELYDILHGVLNVYSGYYLQAVSILSSQLVDVRILKILDKVNPDRDIRTALTSNPISIESFDESTDDFYENSKSLSLKGAKYSLPLVNHTYISTEDDDSLTTSLNKLETFEKFGAALGKVLEVKFTVSKNGEEKQVSIPVVVKLNNMVIPSTVVRDLMTINTEEITLGSRFKDMLAGRISFFKDFIMAEDLIKKQKKAMIKDPTGYFVQIIKRLNNSRLYSALTRNPSLGAISSIIVISNEDEEYIQRNLGGTLNNLETRDMIFNNTSAMMIVVVDKEWERVSMYIRDIDGFSQNSFSDFKSQASKDSNIADIIKAFSVNSAPTF